MIKKNNKIFIIDVNSICYFIVFILFLATTIFFISSGIKGTDITMQLTKVYNQDQANAINAVADSAIGKVNNIIAITAIFFTVLVASISVFQILKFKDFEKMKKSMLAEINDFNESISNLENDLVELELSKEELYEHSIELELEINIFKINAMFKESLFNTAEFISMINRVLFLSEKYPHLIKSKEELANMYYYKYVVSLNDIKELREENKIGIKKAIELVKDKNPIVTKKYSRALMDLYRIDNDEYEIEKQLHEIIDLVDFDIEDSIGCLLLYDIKLDRCNDNEKINIIDDIISELEILKYCYGSYATSIIKRNYDQGRFNYFLKDTQFKNKLLKLINE